ncbi:MAG TPA: hypothetical protein VEU08_06000 [Vicinamibacterales bacterium]|nr:hypothetical protein [Vicinamibacterales bacterium]
MQYNGAPVILSYDTTKSNYPGVNNVIANFAAAAGGTLTAGNQSLSYKTTATLLTMQYFTSFDGLPSTIQTWQLVSDGGLANSTKVTVEVSALFETPKVPAYSMAAFATNNQCGALQLNGNVGTDSYNSGGLSGTTTPPQDKYDGDVGTNGNMTVSGGAASVYGNLYSPRAGVGACSTVNVTALTETGTTLYNQDGTPKNPQQAVQLPKAVAFPTPTIPSFSTLAGITITNGGTTASSCGGLGYTGPLYTGCSVSGKIVTLTAPPLDGSGNPITMPSVSLSSQTELQLVGNATYPNGYAFNSITETGQATVGVKVNTPPVGTLINIVGQDNSGNAIATPLDLTGGSTATPDLSGCGSCSQFDASLMQFVYGGTGQIKIQGNVSAAASFYAPNASADLGGTADLYGSIVAATLYDHGVAGIHYDRKLQTSVWIAGQPMSGTFSWKRF